MKREDIHWMDEDITLPEEEYREAQEEEPIPSHTKRHIVLLIVIIICAVGVIAFFLSDTFYNLTHAETSHTLETTSARIEYENDGVTSIQAFGQLVVRINADGAQAVNTKGAVVWDLPYSMNNPYMVQAGDYVAIADLRGNQVVIANKSGLVNTITTENTILFCTVNESGNIAAVLDGDTENTILVYDSNGNILVRRVTYISSDGIPMAVALNEDASCMATSYLVYTETELRSVVTLFNLTDDSLQTADKIVGNYSFSDTLITDLRYMKDDLIYIGDDRFGGIRITGNTSEDWEVPLSYQIQSFGFGDDYLAISLGDGLAGVAGEPEQNLLVYAADGEALLGLSLDNVDAITVGSSFLVYQDGLTYTAMDTDGHTRWTYTADNSLYCLYSLGSDYAISASDGIMQILEIISIEETEVSP